MSDQFERYEQDLIEVIKSAKIKLADQIPITEKAEERRQLIRQVTKEVDDMNSIIGDMDFFMSKTGPNSRGLMANKIKKYKFDVEIVQKELKKAISDSNKVKSSQFNSQDLMNDPERKRALQIHSSIKNAGDSLARSTQIAIETEQIGTSVLGELNEQGEKLRKTNDTLDDTSAALSRSRKLINSLSRGVFYNKFLMIIIIILEICILGGVIYWKFFTKH